MAGWQLKINHHPLHYANHAILYMYIALLCLASQLLSKGSHLIWNFLKTAGVVQLPVAPCYRSWNDLFLFRNNIQKLQAVHNFACHITSGTRKYDHITPFLKELRWLPVASKLFYCNAIIAFKCMLGAAFLNIFLHNLLNVLISVIVELAIHRSCTYLFF